MMMIILFGIALIVIGLYYHVKRAQLESDPILIATCYIWGAITLATCLAS